MSYQRSAFNEVNDWALSLGKHKWNAHKCEKNHACDYCGDYFLKSSQLNFHILQKHTEGNHECNTCEKRFLVPSLLKIHIESVHEGRRDHKCAECGKGFYNSKYLKVALF